MLRDLQWAATDIVCGWKVDFGHCSNSVVKVSGVLSTPQIGRLANRRQVNCNLIDAIHFGAYLSGAESRVRRFGPDHHSEAWSSY
jgi:hypothetical protein